MARIRTIKPEFWTDGKVLSLDYATRLFYIGMWNFVCDRGHVADDPIGLKFKILPADAVDGNALVDSLIEGGMVERMKTPDERSYLWIRRFEDHQKVDPRWNSRCPICMHLNSAGLTETHSNSGEFDETPPRKGKERKGKESKGKDKPSSEVADATIRPDVSYLLDLLDSLVVENGSKKPSRSKANSDAARLILDKDGRSVEQVEKAIRWSQSDDFWKSNILSFYKLREKYDQLRLAAQRKQGASSERKLTNAEIALQELGNEGDFHELT